MTRPTTSPRSSAPCRFIAFIAFAIAVLFADGYVRACTAFLQSDLLAGKNYDWHLDQGLLIVNKSGIAKRSMMLDPTDTPAEWVSRYGSVTFNQYGREMPNGGMNEAGLVIETLMLPGTLNPARDDRPAVTAWLQYQLDNSRTVDEVVASDKTVRISQAMPMPLHFFVCDSQGHAAVVEFLNGKFVCHSGDQLPYKLITNNTCAQSLEFLSKRKGFGGTEPIRQGSHDSLDRFAIAADRLRSYRPESSRPEAIQYAFETLAAVRQGDATKWSIVYDLKSLEIHYKTERCSEVRTVRLKDLDFGPQSPVRMIGINTPHTDLLNPHLADYDPDVNRWLVFYTVRHTPMIAMLPDALVEMLAVYPETTSPR